MELVIKLLKKEKFLNLLLGYSHPIIFDIPDDLEN